MSKPNLLILHGALGTKDFCLSLLPLLTPHFEVFSFDFIGHGTYKWKEEALSMETLSEQVLSFLQENKIEKPHVFGYSMGGYTAMYLEKMQPNTFASIMTFATIYNWTPENAKKQVAQLNWEKIQQKIPHFAQIMQDLHGGKTSRLFATLVETFLAMGENPPISTADFAQIALPVWLGVGDRDNAVSIEETVEAYRKLPNGKLFVLPNVPHPFEKVDVAALAMMMLKCLAN